MVSHIDFVIHCVQAVFLVGIARRLYLFCKRYGYNVDFTFRDIFLFGRACPGFFMGNGDVFFLSKSIGIYKLILRFLLKRFNNHLWILIFRFAGR